MPLMKRSVAGKIASLLQKRMVFVSGPRQVGKTTLAQMIGEEYYKKPTYYNWDNTAHRKRFLEHSFPDRADLLMFDEIHKYRNWKNELKGIYDINKEKYHIVVTGSARLAMYKQGGDSLLGRYFHVHLHPFSLAELLSTDTVQTPMKILQFSNEHQNERKVMQTLLTRGGFPEAFLEEDESLRRLIQQQHNDRLVKEDIRDATLLRDISALQILVSLLPDRVGSLLSLESLRGDIGVDHKTIAHWMDVLEEFFIHFRIPPFSSTLPRSLRKHPKMYLWDWSSIQNEHVRYENMIASHLLKFVHHLRDFKGYNVNLCFLRDKEGREVDFIVTYNRKPWFAVEVKSSATKPSKHLHYFARRLNIPHLYQLTMEQDREHTVNGVHLMSVEKFLMGLW